MPPTNWNQDQHPLLGVLGHLERQKQTHLRKQDKPPYRNCNKRISICQRMGSSPVCRKIDKPSYIYLQNRSPPRSEVSHTALVLSRRSLGCSHKQSRNRMDRGWTTTPSSPIGIPNHQKRSFPRLKAQLSKQESKALLKQESPASLSSPIVQRSSELLTTNYITRKSMVF